MYVRLLSFAAAALLVAGPASGAGPFSEEIEKARAAAGAGKSLEAYEALKEAELALWNSMTEIFLRKTVLVTEEPPLFEAYVPRKDNRYRPGEAIFLFAEPVGYTILEQDGVYSYDVTADVTIVDSNGVIRGGQKDFGSWKFASRRPVVELGLYFTFDLSGLDEGDYIIETVIRDRNSPKTASFSTPVTIVP